MNIRNASGRRFNNPFVALTHRNFRLYWLGMCVSLIGTWMQNMAQPWLAYTLTKSPFLLSLVGTFQFMPVLLFSLFAGVIIDKYPKKRIIIFTQSVSLLITFTLGMLVLLGRVQYWHILLLALALGMVNTLDMPARQSFVIELAGKEDLMNAVALNSSIFNIARVVGPALAGLVMGYFGIAWCFFINSISFAAVLLSLIFVKPRAMQSKFISQGKILSDIKAGLKYIYRTPVLLTVILLITIVGTFGMNFNVLVPVFAKVVLKQGEMGFGILMSCMGMGSFAGAMLVAAMSKSGPKRFTLVVFPLFIGIFLILTGLTNTYLISAISLAITGFFFVYFSSMANSTLQLNTKDELRGRVMSVYSLVFAGSTPIGNLYAGIFTEHFGPQVGFAACGTIIILLLVPLYLRWYLRSKDKMGESRIGII
ncbi:MAG: MFS transporter [Syntrophomonas sp.]